MPSEKRLRQREGHQARQEELRRAQQQSRKRRQFIIGAVIVVLFGVVFYFTTKSNGSSKKVATGTSTTSAPGATTTTKVGSTATTVLGNVGVIAAPAGTACPKLDGSSPHYTRFSAVPPTCIDPAKSYTATMQTDVGNIVIALNPKLAPNTVNNFVFLAGYHFYDGTIFHRVIPGFVDQGGDPTAIGSGSPGYSFADELPQPTDYKEGGVAMANSGANTNGSQFYILIGSTAAQQLLGGAGGVSKYSLFGQVTSGLDVATKINTDGSTAGTPTVVHKIIKVTVAAT